MVLPIGPPLLAWAGGMTAAWFLPAWRDVFLLCAVAAAPVALVGFLSCRNGRARGLPLLCLVFFLAAARTAVRIDPEFSRDHLIHLTSGGPVLLEGTLWDEPAPGPNSTRLPFRADVVRTRDGARSVRGKADLYVPAFVPELHVGDVLILEARLQRIRDPGNPGEFDRRSRSHLKKVYVKGSVTDAARILRVGSEEGYGILRWIQKVRLRLSRFMGGEPSCRSRALLKALILGDRSGLPEDLQDSFRRSGLAHLLAISGLHVGLVGLFCYGIVKSLLRRSGWILLRGWLRKLAALLSLPPVLLYVLLAGSPITALRAACMALCLTVGLLLDRPAATWNALGVAALFLLLNDPSSLFSISFLLSFASVACILSVAPLMKNADRPEPQGQRKTEEPLAPRLKNAVGKFFRAFLLVSVAATLGTLPLCAYFFHQVSLVGVLANVVVVPLVGWGVMPLGLLAALSSVALPWVAPLLLDAAVRATEVAIQLVEFFGRFYASSIRVISPTVWEMLLWYASLGLVMKAGRSVRARRGLAACLAGLLLSLAHTAVSRRLSREVEMTVLSVGQGESILIELPGGKRMLVDGGMAREGFYDAGRWIVSPFLGSCRIRRLDWLVVSHGHPDHYGGLRFLARAMRPREIWTGPPTECEDPDYRAFLESCARMGIRRRLLCEGRGPMSFNGVTVEVLGPACGPEGRAGAGLACPDGLNNQSLVLRLTYGTVKILLTGDIEKAVELRLREDSESLAALVLKVPHHGSRSSSTPAFLDAVSPRVAVVSAGYRNRFHFPSPEALRRYGERGIPVFRTDVDGAIRIRTDGKSVEVRPWRGDAGALVIPP